MVRKLNNGLSENIIEEAKNNPGGWVYKVDEQFCRSGNDIAPEAIVGAWKVDDAGEITGGFIENKNYRKKVKP